MRPTKRTTALHFNDLTPPGTTESHRKDGKTQLLDHNRTTSKALGSLDFDLDKFLVDDTFVVTSVKSLLCHVSTSFRINSKFRRIRSTPTEMQSMRENDFECVAST
jgi:hypothetical protein